MPNIPPPEARQMEQLFREKLFRFATEGAPVVLFDAPPRGLPPLDLKEQPMSSLPAVAVGRHYPYGQHWRDEQLNAVSALMLGCVFDGEADYRVHTPPGKKGAQWTLTLKAGTLFMIAPETSFSDGSKVPWERPNPERAYSRAVLMQLRAEGVICHTFTSDKGELWLHPYLFLYNFEVLPLGEKLLEELRREHPSLTVVYLYWQLILRLLERTLHEGNVSVLYEPSNVSADVEREVFSAVSGLVPQSAMQLALQYIDSHLDDPNIKVRTIARYAGLSERHLIRLFQNINGISPFAYLQQKRLEKACVLLQHSKLSIRRVGSYCGFKSLSHFSTWFARHKNISPRDYRLMKK